MTDQERDEISEHSERLRAEWERRGAEESILLARKLLEAGEERRKDLNIS